jgi:hypothetical protein
MKSANLVGTLPRNWEWTFRYDGDARYVAFYWTPAGDEAVYDDGQVSGDGNWHLFLTLRHQHPELDQRYNDGYSDLEADHWLLLDREARSLMVLPKAEAQARLRQQWPLLDLDAELTFLDWEIIQAAVHQALTRTEVAMQHTRPCDTCFYSIAPGWLQADDGGFDSSPLCYGWGFLPLPVELASSVLDRMASSLLPT